MREREGGWGIKRERERGREGDRGGGGGGEREFKSMCIILLCAIVICVCMISMHDRFSVNTLAAAVTGKPYTLYALNIKSNINLLQGDVHMANMHTCRHE